MSRPEVIHRVAETLVKIPTSRTFRVADDISARGRSFVEHDDPREPSIVKERT